MSAINEFLKHLTHSQLIPKTRLRTLLGEFQAAEKALGKSSKDLQSDQLCRFLIQKNEITAWQAEKLLSGKFRGFFLGKYKLLRLLGTGGMSVVYLAQNQTLGQQRAIKVLPKSRIGDSSYLERFYLEARAAAALDHPNIVKTFDIDNEEDQHFMVMEFVQGEDLSALVKRRGRVPVGQAVEWIVQAATALQHAHDAGLIHRDVKPSNFLIDTTGQLKLMDLGLAKFSDNTTSLTVMHNETLMGTADYLSPEQAISSHQVDHRTDLYSLGGTLYFMLAGHPPFPEGTIAQRLAMHQAIEPPTLASLHGEIPGLVSDVCRWLMVKTVPQRCPSAGDAIQVLRAWQKDPQVHWPLPLPAAPDAGARHSLAKTEPDATSGQAGSFDSDGSHSLAATLSGDHVAPTSPWVTVSAAASDSRKSKRGGTSPPALPRAQRRKSQAIWILGGLTFLLVATIGLLVWLFFFRVDG